MGVLANERAIVAKILDHIDRKTTDLSQGVWREPVEHYTSRSRFEAELSQVLRRWAVPFCPSAALPEPGSYLARDAALTPIVAIRGTDRKVRAFRNACRHRGVQLVNGSGCRKALTCRYHAWTYGLDGSLRGIPNEYGFPGIDKQAYGLVPVATSERHGIVFVAQDGTDADPNDLEPLDGLLPADMALFDTAETEFEANWKIVLEGSLEGYHIRSTHHDTFYPIQYDNINVVESFGRNSRISFPYRRIEKLRSVAPEEWKTSGMLTHVYHLFPNVIVATFPNNTLFTVLEPLSPDRTRLVTYTLSNDEQDEDSRAAVMQARDFVTAGTAEDREMACAAQRGLATGANDVFTFGLFEGAIGHFHRNLADALSVYPT